MPRLTRTRDDAGIAAMLIMMFVGSLVLVGMLAMVIDLGQLMNERRQLQNGAESAAISAAFDCSNPPNWYSSGVSPCGIWQQTSTYSATGVTPVQLASRAAVDKAAALRNYCGKDSNNLLAACQTAISTQRDCPRTPTGNNWVQVSTSTLTQSGQTRVPALFAQAVMPGYTGQAVSACAQAAWGPPGAFDGVIGIAIDKACWDSWVNAAGGVYGPSSYVNPSTWERVLKFGNGSVASGNCVGTTVSSMGFGWLASTDFCTVDVSLSGPSKVGSWMYGDSGGNIPTTSSAGKPSCKDMVNAATLPNGFERSKLAVPIFDCVYHLTKSGSPTTNCPTSVGAPSGTLANGIYYHIVGYASWFMTGYKATTSQRFPTSNAAPYTTTYNNLDLCSSSDTCISGWFARATLLAKATIGTGEGQVDYGLNVVQLVG